MENSDDKLTFAVGCVTFVSILGGWIYSEIYDRLYWKHFDPKSEKFQYWWIVPEWEHWAAWLAGTVVACAVLYASIKLTERFRRDN